MSFHRERHIKKTRAAKWCGWCEERIEEKGEPEEDANPTSEPKTST